jgi:hypothetical protein
MMRMRVLLISSLTVLNVSVLPACFGQGEMAPSWTDPQGSAQAAGNGFNSSSTSNDGSLRGPISPNGGTTYGVPTNTMPVAPFSTMPAPPTYAAPVAPFSSAPAQGTSPIPGTKVKSSGGGSAIGGVGKAAKTNLQLTDKAAKVNLGMTDRAAKTTLGLTDRAAKATIGYPVKGLKEVFKTIF